MILKLPPVYPITDKKVSGKKSHLTILRELARGGATLVQVRDKHTPVRELLDDLRRCVDFAERRDILLIVNDRCDLVLSAGAGGVHLGQDDLPPKAARRILGPDRIIGHSTHSIAQVRRAASLPVQYLGFGPVYPTRGKADPSPVAGVEQLRSAVKTVGLPVVAIGGITLDRVEEVLGTGAASVAVISDLMRARSLARRMEQFLAAATATR